MSTRAAPYVVDVTFFMDIFIQMNTCYTDKLGGKIFSRSKIVYQYATTWMLLDIASVLPLDTISVFMVRGGAGCELCLTHGLESAPVSTLDSEKDTTVLSTCST